MEEELLYQDPAAYFEADETHQSAADKHVARLAAGGIDASLDIGEWLTSFVGIGEEGRGVGPRGPIPAA